MVLTGSHQYSGKVWTDSGSADEERALKHRSQRDVRHVPLHPELVETLLRHVRRFAPGADGRLFITRTGKAGTPLTPPYLHLVSTGIIYGAWHRARATALTPKQFNSLLARRPYDLRHACLSTWLNAGVPPPPVAEWAGHGIDVLLRVYAGCIDGQEEAAKSRIEAALGGAQPAAGPEKKPRIRREDS